MLLKNKEDWKRLLPNIVRSFKKKVCNILLKWVEKQMFMRLCLNKLQEKPNDKKASPPGAWHRGRTFSFSLCYFSERAFHSFFWLGIIRRGGVFLA